MFISLIVKILTQHVKGSLSLRFICRRLARSVFFGFGFGALETECSTLVQGRLYELTASDLCPENCPIILSSN